MCGIMFHRDYRPYYDVYNNGDDANNVYLYYFNTIILNCKTSFKREFLCLYMRGRAERAPQKLCICMAQRVEFP